MTRLNSRLTYINKYLFPTVWFGFLLFFFFQAPVAAKNETQKIIFMVAPFPMALFGYYLMRKMLFGLVNEVYRSGDYILCKNGDKRIKVSLSEIQSAIYYTQTQPQKCVLRLNKDTVLGREIEFIPKIGWRPFSFNQDVDLLIDQVHQQNQGRT